MSGSGVQEAAATEEEAREATAKVKKAILWSALVSTPLMLLIAWFIEAETWVWVVVVGIAVYEAVSFPFLMRMLDRGLERRVAEIRAEQGLTPADQLPDVGV